MRFFLFFLLIFSCTNDSQQTPNGSDAKTDTQKEPQVDDVTTQIKVQQFAQSQSQYSFDIMPISKDGSPLGCDDSNVDFDINIYKDNNLIEDKSSVQINCLEKSSSQVGLVLDNSGSVRDHRLIVNRSVSDLSKSLFDLGSQVSLVEVNTNSFLRVPLTNSLNDIHNGVNDFINRPGWTALYDGVRLSHESLNNGVIFSDSLPSACEHQRKALIVMTDGEENNSYDQMYEEYSLKDFPGDSIDTTLEDVKSLKSNMSTTPVFTIGVGNSVNSEELKDISESTGGTYISLKDFKELGSTFSDINNYLSSPYNVCVQTQNFECGDYKIELSYTTGKDSIGEKSIHLRVPCEDDSDGSNEFEDQEVLPSVSETNLIDSDELRTNYELDLMREISFPLFDDEDGRKELLGVNLEFESKKDVMLNIKESEKISRIHGFEIYDESKDIINISKRKESSEIYDQGFSDSDLISGVYNIPSHHFNYFKGDGTKKIFYKAYEKLSWNTPQKIKGHIEIEGNFKLKYIWRYRDIRGVVIPDDQLRLAVRNALNVRTGPISVEAMESLVSLDVSNKNIESFVGLNYAMNLRNLNIKNTNVRDIDFLSKHLALETLDVSSNKISHYQVLSQLKNLKSLYANNTSFSDLNIIKNLSALTNVQIDKTDVKDLFPLREMLSLKSLRFRYCDIQNYFHFEHSKSLTSIDLYGCVNDPHQNLALRKDQTYSFIHLGKTHLSSLDKLHGVHVNNLNISNNNFGSLQDVSKINSIQTLTASSNKLIDADFQYALHIPTLVQLSLNNNLISNPFFENAYPVLKRINLNNNKIQNLKFINNFLHLNKIYISNNPIQSLTPLSVNKELVLIQAQNASIEGINDLMNLEKLSSLDLSYNDFSSKSFINFSNFPSLSSLIIRSISQSNISFINSLKFSYFDLRYNQINCEEQTLLVEKQYSGFQVLYDEVENCPYVYQKGVTEKSIFLTDSYELGVEYFGSFLGVDYIEKIFGNHVSSIDVIELNTYEHIKSIDLDIKVDIETDTSVDSDLKSEILLDELFTLRLIVSGKVFHESSYSIEQLFEHEEGHRDLSKQLSFSKTITLNESEVEQFMSSDKVDYEIVYETNSSISSEDDTEFSILHKSVGSLKLKPKFLPST